MYDKSLFSKQMRPFALYYQQFVAERNAIKVTHGAIFIGWDSKRQFRQNRQTYWLDLATAQWSRSTKGSTV